MSDQQGFVAKSLSAHGLLGLILGALIFQICLTGTLTVFAGELRQWEQPTAPVVTEVSPEGYANAIRTGKAIAGVGGPPVILLGPTSALPRLEIRVPGKAGGGYADASGAIREPVGTGWTDFVTELHERLYLPGIWGIALVAIAGVALLAALITGIAAHPRIFRDAFRLRRGGNVQLEQADLHNRTGVWGLPFHVVVTLSGCFLALVPVLGPPLALIAYGGDIERAATEMAGEVEAKAPTPNRADVAKLIRQVEREHAPARVSFVMLQSPGTNREVLQIDTDVPRQLATGESYSFDGNGALIGVAGYADGPFHKQLQSAMFQLHFGSFGGPPVRLLYGMLGIGLCWLIATGMRIWFLRQQARGQNVARWQRLWSAVLWGQIAALAGSAVAARMSVDPVFVFLLLTGISLAAAVPRVDPSNFNWATKGIAGCCLLLMAVVPLFAEGLQDPVALCVSGSAFLFALLLLIATYRQAIGNLNAGV
ncbi:MAG: PepSY domain-containing protein [Sphingopyxis sp.]|nr:PepSY domain-containing protein [Sphingopyxis sp.]